MRELRSLWHFSRRFSSIDGRKVERGKREVKEGGGGRWRELFLYQGRTIINEKESSIWDQKTFVEIITECHQGKLFLCRIFGITENFFISAGVN